MADYLPGSIKHLNTLLGEQLTDGGGGGGSSDFSTAEVTIINNSNDNRTGTGFACYEENELGEGSPLMLINLVFVPVNGQVTLKVPMYKGIAIWNNGFGATGTEATTTGDIVNESGNFTITGNGTITLS